MKAKIEITVTRMPSGKYVVGYSDSDRTGGTASCEDPRLAVLDAVSSWRDRTEREVFEADQAAEAS